MTTSWATSNASITSITSCSNTKRSWHPLPTIPGKLSFLTWCHLQSLWGKREAESNRSATWFFFVFVCLAPHFMVLSMLHSNHFHCNHPGVHFSPGGQWPDVLVAGDHSYLCLASSGVTYSIPFYSQKYPCLGHHHPISQARAMSLIRMPKFQAPPRSLRFAGSYCEKKMKPHFCRSCLPSATCFLLLLFFFMELSDITPLSPTLLLRCYLFLCNFSHCMMMACSFSDS